MRLRGGRDLNLDSHLELAPSPCPVTWLPGALSKGVRLRLRQDRRDHRGRSCWHLVDLDPESEPTVQSMKSQDTDTQSLMSSLSAGSEMQASALDPQFIPGPQGKVPGRKRGRPPIRKLEFQSHYVETLSPLKIPKKRGRKPGFKLKPRMVMSPLANSPPSSTPEPEMGSIPQDAAIVPHSATPQVLTAYSPMSDAGECKRPVGKDPSSWGVEDVVWFIKDADPQALGPHAEAFRKHEIDGDALLLLKSEMMMKYLGLKLGPALKLCYHIDRLKQSRS
ncbi:sex comb on midleg-like protein 4 isoform X2 [Oreochromis aureus]|uniref:sex comb on midleg-like protein 4 isoform X2 n=1 Tax=Oreochromis aureus TaxID=47969 RepID=UPI0019533B28|nr:sex comb on midleg-like protein 4 isoform X2 [Oreochromis aureus]